MNSNLVVEKAGAVDASGIDSEIENSKPIALNTQRATIVEVEERLTQQPLPADPVSSLPMTRAAQAPASQPRQLFAQSFVELSGAERRRRRWTQTGSFLIQGVIVAILVIIPLWYIDVLPAQQLAFFLVAPPPPPPPPPPAAPSLKATKVVSEVVNGQLLAPDKIPQKVKNIKEEEAPAPVSGVIGGVEGGVPGGTAGGVIGSLLSTPTHTASVPTIAAPKRVRVSTGISEGLLSHRVEPLYPLIAQRARIEGTVELKAVISKEGTIEGLQRINGHPLLVTAAMDAVKQWRYRPYMLNGEPLEVETVVVVNFHMH
jgi:periplasmic protein TonB